MLMPRVGSLRLQKRLNIWSEIEGCLFCRPEGFKDAVMPTTNKMLRSRGAGRECESSGELEHITLFQACERED